MEINRRIQAWVRNVHKLQEIRNITFLHFSKFVWNFCNQNTKLVKEKGKLEKNEPKIQIIMNKLGATRKSYSVLLK